MTAQELIRLHGQNVLVKSTQEHRDPPVALRGTLDAREVSGQPVVKIVLEFPDMFNKAAHRGVILLNERETEQLLASEHDGVYEFTTTMPLDPGPDPKTEQASE